MTDDARNELRMIGALMLAYKAHRKDHWRFHICTDLCMVDIARRQKRFLDEEPAA